METHSVPAGVLRARSHFVTLGAPHCPPSSSIIGTAAVSIGCTKERHQRPTMKKKAPSALLRYGMAPAAVLAALLMRFCLWPIIGYELPFLLLWPAISICAWYGGFGPGLVATLLSLVAAHVVLFESHIAFAMTDPNGVIGLGLFVLLGLSISVLGEMLRQAKRRLEAYAQEVFNQREWLRVTLGSIGDGVIATDTAGRVTLLNAVAESLTGWTQQQAAGRPMENVFHIVNEQTRQLVENPVRKVLQTGATVGLANHTMLLAKDGQERPIDDSAAPIRSDDETTLGVVLVFRDVTERRRLENELRQRMRELAEADQRKNQFLAMLAHELRSPLAPACNAVWLLRSLDPGHPKFPWAREVVQRQLQQMARLVDDLLDVSRITTGKIRLQKDAVELHDILERAVEISRPLLEARRHELTESLPAEPVWLHADPTRLAQVISNLLTNAAKYTEDGGHIWLTACVEKESDTVTRWQGDKVTQEAGHRVTVSPCHRVRISVRDNGIGIAANMLPHIFDLFTQVERSLERSEGGLGVGLTLVRRLVEMHGGQVRAHSAGLGQGSEFEVWLPLGKSHLESRSALVDDQEPGASSRRVLVVDDNRDAAETLAVLLRADGHDVHVAFDGLTALKAADILQPEVILLDIGLPQMDGYEVARRLRQLPGLEKALLIALTGYGQEEDRRRSHEAGFDRHLVKPIDVSMLQTLLACPELEVAFGTVSNTEPAR
jgi:PAS domain S-box-containing protein